MSARTKFMIAICVSLWPALSSAAPREVAEARSNAPAEWPVKPTGPIAVEHHLGAEPAVGVSLTITISARVSGSTDSLRLEATASRPEAVLLTAPRLVASAESEFTWVVTVVPLAADAGYLNVAVAGDVDGLPQARSVAIALRGAPSAIPAESAGHGNSETLIALPVRETP
jgi:hypothetical protein